MLYGRLTRLRALDPGDLNRYIEWLNDPEVVEHLGAVLPFVSHPAEQEWLERASKKPVAFGDLTLAIETAEGRHIGSVALHDPNVSARHAVLGILIGDKTCWDQGYGTDAIETLLRYGFDEMNLHRVSLTVNEDNARGIACYRKCGFVEEGRLRDDRYARGAYHDTLVMGLLEGEWRARQGATASS
jgi:RimJ/RimL family protein N-acetyltransferase